MFLTWKLLYGVSKTNTKLLNTKIYIKKNNEYPKNWNKGIQISICYQW